MSTKANKFMDELIEILRTIYTDGEIAIWFRSPQKMLGNKSPAVLASEGKHDKVINFAKKTVEVAG